MSNHVNELSKQKLIAQKGSNGNSKLELIMVISCRLMACHPEPHIGTTLFSNKFIQYEFRTTVRVVWAI